ncbi:hypothetical protein S245_069642, partial [Arachis hypogaea]
MLTLRSLHGLDLLVRLCFAEFFAQEAHHWWKEEGLRFGGRREKLDDVRISSSSSFPKDNSFLLQDQV